MEFLPCAHGGKAAYPFLIKSLDELLDNGGNDVELAGIIDGIVRSGDPRSERRLLRIFKEYCQELHDGGRYVAVHAAIGLQSIRPELLESGLGFPAAYSTFSKLAILTLSSSFATGGRARDLRRKGRKKWWSLAMQLLWRHEIGGNSWKGGTPHEQDRAVPLLLGRG